MVKRKAAPAAGASTPSALAAWPFPKSPKGVSREENSLEAPDAALLSNVKTDEPDTSMAGDGQEHEAERIRVDQVNLYTDPSQNTIELVAIEELEESPFNPRTSYDQKALHDLAETIRGVGVMQPLLVRPLSVDGLLQFNRNNRGHDGERPRFEIIYGHRRFRGAKLAGETRVPVICRELTDLQAAQLQAIENVQRKDLDAIEEALGYQYYIDKHRVTKDQLADEIGLSRTHVYNRLKLLNAVDTVKDAVRAGEIGNEVALLVARIPSARLQEKALAALKSNHHSLGEGGKTSYRRIKDFLKEKFTLRLKDAVFPTDDATLLAGADACTTCPKRTGNAIEFADLAAEDVTSWNHAGPNLCTDPECWDAKKTQHLANKAAELAAKGKTVITGAKARQAVGADGTVKGAYIALKEVKGELAKAKKAGKGGDVQVVLIQDPRTGKTFEAVKRDEVKAAGGKVKEAPKQRSDDSWRKEQAKREAKADEERRINYAVLGAVRQAAAGQPLPAKAVQLVAQVAFAGVAWRDKQAIFSLYGVEDKDELVDQLANMPAERLTTLLLDCALVENVHTESHTLNEKPASLLWAAEHYGIDVEEIRSDLADVPVDTKTPDLLTAGGDQSDEEQLQDEGVEA